MGNIFKKLTIPGVSLIQKIGQTKFGHYLCSTKVANWLSRHEAVPDAATGKWEYETIPGKTKTWIKQAPKADTTKAERAQHIVSGFGELTALGGLVFGGIMIVNAIVAPAAVADVKAAAEDLEMFQDVAALSESIYSEQGLFNVLDEAMLESDFDYWTSLQYISSVNLTQNEDKSGTLTFKVGASFDKKGDLEPHTFIVKFNISEKEYNTLVECYNPQDLYSTLADNQAKVNTIDMFKLFDLEEMKKSIDTLTKTIDGKECSVVLKDYLELELKKSEDKKAYISPVLDKYYDVLIDANAFFAENYTDDIKFMLRDANPIEGKTVQHYFSYDINEDGSFNVQVYTQVAHHAPLRCDLKISNTNILFSEVDLATAIANFFSNTEQEVKVELANSEIEIKSFTMGNDHSEYVWSAINSIATTTEAKFVAFVESKYNVTINKNDKNEYEIVEGKREISLDPDVTIEQSSNTDSSTTEDKQESVDSNVTSETSDANSNNSSNDLVEDVQVESDVTVD